MPSFCQDILFSEHMSHAFSNTIARHIVPHYKIPYLHDQPIITTYMSLF